MIVMVKTKPNRQIAAAMPKQMSFVGSALTGVDMYVDLDHAFLIDDLATICSRLPRRDNVLAGMLIKWFDNQGTLSARQLALGQEILQRNQELVNA
ncbi:MAG: hypothetical protein EBZ25_08280 [Flavobacteriia bacterium]|jgi:hypothetical protein|nr:hypothetical protein [Flavobacteriia bacterium]